MRELRYQRGDTLIEVLVAIVLLSLGMLAMAATHAAAARAQRGSHHYALAVALAEGLAERIRGNPAGMALGAYSSVGGPTLGQVSVPACTVVAACTPTEIAAIDVAEMQNVADQLLPSGGVSTALAADGSSTLDIWVRWTPPATSAGVAPQTRCPDGTNDSATQCVFLRVAR